MLFFPLIIVGWGLGNLVGGVRLCYIRDLVVSMEIDLFRVTVGENRRFESQLGLKGTWLTEVGEIFGNILYFF